MQYAILNNKRIVPPSSGFLAICQICGQPVRAYCGELNMDHWRHVKLSNCDLWHSHETPWHREWKLLFPENFREVVIENENEIHRADIKTPKGLVVEFQNSPISSLEIRVREKFYGQMIWVVNTDEFKENISFRSVVTRELSNLRRYDHNPDIEAPEKKMKKACQPISDRIDRNKIDIFTLENRIEWIQNSISTIDGFLNDMTQFTRDYIKNRNRVDTDYYNPKILNKLNILKTRIDAFNRDIQVLDKNINEIDSLENYPLQNLSEFKIINNNKRVDPKNYREYRAIKRETLLQIFPELISFNSEFQLKAYINNPNFVLIKDFRLQLQNLNDKKMFLENKIIKRDKTVSLIDELFSKDATDYFISKKVKFQEELITIKKSLPNLEEKRISLSFELDICIQNAVTEAAKSNKKFEDDFKKKEFSIMKEYKGLYILYWKYRHKSWDAASQIFFLEYNGFLYQLQRDVLFKKIEKKRIY
jgi:hypothetical protein